MAALVQGLSRIELDDTKHSKDDAPLCRTPRAKRNEVAWKWYESIGAPKLFVAPLVGYSEPAFRLLCRSYGADIASTPMIDAAGYVASERYRAEFAFTGGTADRPLTVQLGGSEPAPLAAAAALVAPHCDAVELNMGCPQRCAKKNGSGAFLMEDVAKATRCLTAMRRALDAHNKASSGPRVATVVKIRCFDDVPRTVALAQALEAAGAEMITVHGRTRHAGGGRRTAAQLATGPGSGRSRRVFPFRVSATATSGTRTTCAIASRDLCGNQPVSYSRGAEIWFPYRRRRAATASCRASVL